MSSKTDAAANANLDTIWGTAGTSVGYVGALTAITSIANGTVTESADGSYGRQAITWAAASGRAKANSAEITFPASTGANGNIVGWGIYAAISGGSPVRICAQDPALTYTTGYQPKVAVGALTVTEGAAA